MHQAKRIEAMVPPAAPPTPFALLGNLLALGWAMVFLALAAVANRRSGR
jgi:apolipoprotein N-acyltransferase